MFDVVCFPSFPCSLLLLRWLRVDRSDLPPLSSFSSGFFQASCHATANSWNSSRAHASKKRLQETRQQERNKRRGEAKSCRRWIRRRGDLMILHLLLCSDSWQTFFRWVSLNPREQLNTGPTWDIPQISHLSLHEIALFFCSFVTPAALTSFSWRERADSRAVKH